ncbi:MAG: protein-glutamate O-methyltransferase CheR [Deltaproteobacteria bacterium]|nr:protein-glutamate O-methyltransferase CheR [Deltaproteobacteria bacterium]
MTSPVIDSTLPPTDEISDEELTEIGRLLSIGRCFDLSVYKAKCMKRRVAIRMRSTRCRDAAAYCGLLRQNALELDLLQKTLTIHVSQFFRNPSMFEKLRSEVLPPLFRAGRNGLAESLRISCLGCASGEEPYSLAILLREHFGRELRRTATTIFGTDIDAETLEAARQAEYNEDRLKEVPQETRERYFRRHGARLRLIPEIREMVTFGQGDIAAVGGYAASNLVLCRNTLIYFTRPDQERILNGIADILPPGGILVLGKSETMVGDARLRFAPLCTMERIYRRV